MCAGQREARDGMVEGGGFPAAGGMAGITVRTELAAVLVILLMAGIAIGRRTLKDVVDVTAQASRADVLADQFESGQVMVEEGRFPACWCVAGAAICAKTTLVIIICRMAGVAVSGSALENMSNMTIHTGGNNVLAGQFECR